MTLSKYICCGPSLCCNSNNRSSDHNELCTIMEQNREEGQALLREMVSGKIDWQAIIEKAEELHSSEQELLRQQSGSERRVFLSKQRKALKKRRQFDALGSFSVNMLSYRLMETTTEDCIKEAPMSEVCSTKDDEAYDDDDSIFRSSVEESSESSSSSSYSSGMDIIDEQLEIDSAFGS